MQTLTWLALAPVVALVATGGTTAQAEEKSYKRKMPWEFDTGIRKMPLETLYDFIELDYLQQTESIDNEPDSDSDYGYRFSASFTIAPHFIVKAEYERAEYQQTETEGTFKWKSDRARIGPGVYFPLNRLIHFTALASYEYDNLKRSLDTGTLSAEASDLDQHGYGGYAGFNVQIMKRFNLSIQGYYRTYTLKAADAAVELDTDRDVDFDESGGILSMYFAFTPEVWLTYHFNYAERSADLDGFLDIERQTHYAGIGMSF